MEKMKAKKIIIIITVILLLGIGIVCIWQYYPYMAIHNNENQQLNTNFVEKSNNFASLMNEIADIKTDTGYSRWSNLKNRKYDKNLLYVYDSLIQNLDFCYKMATYEENNDFVVSNANYIAKFKDYEHISKNKFKQIISGYEFNNEDCLKKFDSYIDMNINDTEVLEYITKITNYYQEIKNKNFTNYREVLDNENNKMDLYLNLAKYFQKKL